MIWGNIKYLFNDSYITDLEDENETLLTTNTNLESNYWISEQGLERAYAEIQDLKLRIKKEIEETSLETYWNNRYPSSSIKYRGRVGYDIDVRQFFNDKDCTLPRINGNNHDEKAYACFDWVRKNIRYASDVGEHWKFSWETRKDDKGDCEDGAILMANMMLRAGIPYWRIRLNAGMVKFNEDQNVGHAYVTYLKEADNKWYVLDWCYWPEKSANWKMPWSKAEITYFDIWFSWNKYKSFNDADFNNEDFEVIQ